MLGATTPPVILDLEPLPNDVFKGFMNKYMRENNIVLVEDVVDSFISRIGCNFKHLIWMRSKILKQPESSPNLVFNSTIAL